MLSHSQVSPLGSLSSPSPSPPLQDPAIDESELSELTEDDRDADEGDAPSSKAKKSPSKSLSKLASKAKANLKATSHNQDLEHRQDRDLPQPRTSSGVRKTSLNVKSKPKSKNISKSAGIHSAGSSASAGSASGHGQRNRPKKRRGIVPAPMWDWAYKTGDSPANATTAPHPHSVSGSAPHANPARKSTTTSTESMSTTPGAEEEEEEIPIPVRAMEEEEGDDDGNDSDTRDGDSQDDSLDDARDDAEGAEDEDQTGGLNKEPRRNQFPPPRKRYRIARIYGLKARPRLHEDEDMEDEGATDGDGNDDEMDVDDEGEVAGIQEQRPHAHPPSSARDSHTKVSPVQREGDVDRPSVLPSNRTSTEPNPADDADPEVPNQGYLSHNLRDALVDDGHRVADEERARDEGPTPVDASAPPSPSSPTSPQHVRPSFAPSPTADDTYLEPEPLDDDRAQDEFIHEPEPEPIEDIDIDEDPDLQPAHRAEALDVLATIELKFALLRESVYIEKMEGLAWEEALVWEGTHPELQHLHAELTKRRDKRLTLAAKKRIHEVKAAERRRREEERREWEEWQIARNELQTEMIAETNRKRRKLERERRTAERPVGVRRIPNPILNPPPAPTLRQIANMFPLPSYLSHIATVSRSSALHGFGITPSHALGLGMGFGAVGSGPTTYPDLPTLLPHEIVSDLDFLFQHRRAGFGGIGFGYGYGMGFGPGVGTGMGGGNLGLHGGLGSFNGGASGPGMVFGPTPGMGLGMNDLAVGPTSGADVYPPNPNHTATGSGVNATIGGTTTLPSQIPVSGGPQQTPLSVHAAVGSVIGPGIGPPPPINADAPMDFHQPPVGIFHSASGPIAPGPGSSNGHALGATAGSGQGGSSGGRIRPSGFALDREGEPRDRDRELVQHDRENDRDFALRDREREPRDRVIVQRERGYGPGYSGWGGKPGGTVDWGAGEGRRREDDVDRDRERDRVGERAGDRAERERDKDRNDRERGNRDKAQAEPIVPTPTHRYSHQHPHSHQLHSSHSSHASHSAPPSHSSRLSHPSHPHQHQHPHPHQHSQHSTHSQHAQHSHQHTQHQYSAHAPPHHHIGQHHHHRHHHHVVHHHHLSGSTHGATGDGRDGSVAGLGVSQGQGQVQTMEIINLSANPASKAHWKREEGKLGGSVSNSRPPSTHPPPNTFAYDEREREREREREQERDRPVAMPFVLGPSHNSITSAASSPRHGWTSAHGDGNGPSGAGRHSPSFLPPLEFHSPVPAGPGSHRFSNANGVSVQLTRPPTSPPRGSAVPSATATLTSPSISNLSAPSTTPNGPFPLQRKPSPALPKLGVNSLLFSPRLAGPGIVPPTGPGVPGVPGVLCGPAAGPGVPPPPTGPGIPSAGPIAGILTSGPGIPPGPGVAPMPTSMPTSVVGHGIPPPTATSGLGIPPTAPGEAMCSGNRTASPLIPYTPPRSGAPTTQKVGVDVDGP